MKDYIITKAIEIPNMPFKIWCLEDLLHDWNLTWYKDSTHSKELGMWDNTHYLNEVCVKGSIAKTGFLKFVEKNYPDQDAKNIYKEFKQLWKFKDKL